jgi:hypothetical protein
MRYGEEECDGEQALRHTKPSPQANAGETFFYRESVDVDYSMEIQRQSGVTLCVNSYGGEIETFA